MQVATCAIGLTSPRVDGKITLVGHRGTEVGEPENTLAAALVAAKTVGFVELDLSTTKNGDVVLMHDETLERTTNGTGRTCDKDMSYIQSLFAKDSKGKTTTRGISKLDEVLAKLPRGTQYMLDVKVCDDGRVGSTSCVPCDVLSNGTMKALSQNRIQWSQITFTSTDAASLQHFQNHFIARNDAATFAISLDLSRYRHSASKVISRLQTTGCDGVSAYLYYAFLRPDVIRTLRKTMAMRGHLYKVFGWTVRTPFQLRAVLCSGIDLVITGDPVRFKKQTIDILGPQFVNTPERSY